MKDIDNGNTIILSRLTVKGSDIINDVVCDNIFINLIITNVKSIWINVVKLRQM